MALMLWIELVALGAPRPSTVEAHALGPEPLHALGRGEGKGLATPHLGVQHREPMVFDGAPLDFVLGEGVNAALSRFALPRRLDAQRAHYRARGERRAAEERAKLPQIEAKSRKVS